MYTRFLRKLSKFIAKINAGHCGGGGGTGPGHCSGPTDDD